ncbi:zinc ribbon domain-containing protein [Clostridium sp. AN503]|uniref:zinc ribbon domain-containing protein n=1 Tax=Clostridium sp. AN503 TaxID=3160598 RepID=UPI00345A5B58
MLCPHCNAAIADDSIFCSFCGKRIPEPNDSSDLMDGLRCPQCGAVVSADANFCTNCRSPLSETAIAEVKKRNDLQLQQAQMQMQAMTLKAQQEQLQIQKMQYDSMARCPRCGSTSLAGNKKGFGIGKAVVGAALVGPIGLVAGNLGAKKVLVTCLKCGKKFKA